MNTPLAFRPVDVRLMVAYMVDAHYVFDACAPDNSLERAMYEEPTRTTKCGTKSVRITPHVGGAQCRTPNCVMCTKRTFPRIP